MSELTRPKLNLKAAYERVKSALTGVKSEMEILDLIAKNSAGNGIYNGKMTVSQRGDYTSPTAVAHNIYYLDRWKSFLQVVAGTITDTGGASRYIATSTGTGRIGAKQMVEDIVKYTDEVVTISAKVTSNTSNVRLQFYNGVSSAFSATHSGGSEGEVLSITVDAGSITSSNFILIAIMDGGGSNVAITSGDYIEFTDVRLDLGSHRLSGDREHGQELALCQRYYWQGSVSVSSASAYHASFIASSFVSFPVVMRVTPSTSFADIVSGGSLGTIGTVFNAVPKVNGIAPTFNTSGATAGYAGYVGFSYTASAEL